jgi:MFS family permease
VLIVPFENEFHWSRATISFAIGINLLVYGLVGPFAAAAMDRFGVRRTMAVSLAVAAAGVALSPLMYNPWQLVLLWGLVVGLSTGFVGAYLAAYIAARWFHARQGMVVGLLTAANAAGQLIFLPTNAALIAYAGWRAMVLILAGIVLLVALPLLLLMRDHPQDLGLFAYGDTTGQAARWHSGNPVAVAFRAMRWGAGAGFLADLGWVFRLWRLNDGTDRYPFDPRLRRSWPDRSNRRGPARCHRCLRRNRRYCFWLAKRPI